MVRCFSSLVPMTLILLFSPRTRASRSPPMPDFCFEHPRVFIPDDYDKVGAPNRDDGRGNPIPLVVDSVSHIVEVTEVDDRKRTVTMPVGIRKQWLDRRIRTNSTAPVFFVDERFFRECLWSPTISFINLETVEVWEMIKHSRGFFMSPSPEGAFVGYLLYTKITVFCSMYFEDYPFDSQTCDVLEMSLKRDDTTILLRSDLIYDPYVQRDLPYQVEIDHSPVTTRNYMNVNFSVAGWRLHMHRSLRTHVMQTYLPTSLFVAASWISFLIPPEVVPGRMALLVTILLMEVSIFLRVSDTEPTSSRISAISAWLVSCIAIVMGAVLQYGVVLYKMFGMKHRSISTFDGRQKKRQRRTTTKKASSGKVRERDIMSLDRWSSVLFPAASFCLAAAYWIIYLNRHRHQYHEHE